MMSDLNFSSLSETSLNWSSLVPSKKKKTQTQTVDVDHASSPTHDDDDNRRVKEAVSLQNAFRESKKSFIERSKHRQQETAAVKKATVESQRVTTKQKISKNNEKARKTQSTHTKSTTNITDGKLNGVGSKKKSSSRLSSSSAGEVSSTGTSSISAGEKLDRGTPFLVKTKCIYLAFLLK